MKVVKEDFEQSRPATAGLLEPLRRTDLMEPFKKDKPAVKLAALRWVIIRDVLVAYRLPVVAIVAALGLAVFEPALAKRLFRAVVLQQSQQNALGKEGATASILPEGLQPQTSGSRSR
jgi:hypothetical protein